MTYRVTASRDQKILAQEDIDDGYTAFERANELLEESDLVIVSDRGSGLVRHMRNMRLTASDRYRRKESA